MPDVIVIGGGIAGLTSAYLLKKQDPQLDVLVLEAQSQAGGNIKTLAENELHMETGPHSFMGSSEYTWKLVDMLGLEEKIEPASPTSKNRYIYRDNRLKPLPMGLFPFIGTTLLSPAAKLRLMMEPFIPNGAKEEETAWEFFCRRFGKEAATYIMTPFISGVYAGDVHMLGARAAFTKFWKFEKDSGSMILGAIGYMRKKRQRLRREGAPIRRGLFSFKNGLGTITQTLAGQLPPGTLQTNVPITAVRKDGEGFIVETKDRSWKSTSVITAAPPPQTGAMLENLVPGIQAQFNAIPMAPVALVHWRVKDNATPYPDGFGFLMPRHYDLRVLGTLFPSKLFQNRIPGGWQLFASFYGGMTDPGAMSLDDDQLTRLLLEEHRRIFNRELEQAEIIKILRYPGAIPQLLPDHPEKIKQIRDSLAAKIPGIFPAGNYISGVGIEHAVESGFNASAECYRFLSGLPARRTTP